MKRMSFENACRKYVHRFTMDHMPDWAKQPFLDGYFYAPQYKSDKEWYENTTFPGDTNYPYPSGWDSGRYCNSINQTWPLGKYLTALYQKGNQ